MELPGLFHASLDGFPAGRGFGPCARPRSAPLQVGHPVLGGGGCAAGALRFQQRGAEHLPANEHSVLPGVHQPRRAARAAVGELAPDCKEPNRSMLWCGLQAGWASTLRHAGSILGECLGWLVVPCQQHPSAPQTFSHDSRRLPRHLLNPLCMCVDLALRELRRVFVPMCVMAQRGVLSPGVPSAVSVPRLSSAVSHACAGLCCRGCPPAALGTASLWGPSGTG